MTCMWPGHWSHNLKASEAEIYGNCWRNLGPNQLLEAQPLLPLLPPGGAPALSQCLRPPPLWGLTQYTILRLQISHRRVGHSSEGQWSLPNWGLRSKRPDSLPLKPLNLKSVSIDQAYKNLPAMELPSYPLEQYHAPGSRKRIQGIQQGLIYFKYEWGWGRGSSPQDSRGPPGTPTCPCQIQGQVGGQEELP